jgi:hypothetical protein
MTALRRAAGILLLLHGLAHASAGMWATDVGGHALVTALWELSTIGFMLAGAGLLGIDALHRHWRAIITVAALSSLTLLLLYSHPLFLFGIAGDFAAIALAIVTQRLAHSTILSPGRFSRFLLLALIGYTGTIIAFRPWYTSWGSTQSEQQMVMIGDPPIGESHYRIDHAITIQAPVDSVWRWVVQIGQDRAGFYSYDWLERLFGADIHNSNAIVPEWQAVRVGHRVRAVQSSYLGGVFGRNLGWKVVAMEPGRSMVLEGWGAFTVQPVTPSITRMHIRTRGTGVPTVSGIALTPVSLLLLEPAHFIMERRMLLGIKERSEAPSAHRIMGLLSELIAGE